MMTDTKAIQRVMRSKPNLTFVTSKQVHCIIRLFETYQPGITRERRIELLRFLVGEIMWDNYRVRVISTKNITSDIASVLISQLTEKDADGKIKLSDDGRKILAGIESDFEEFSAGEKDRVGASGLSGDMSTVQKPALPIPADRYARGDPYSGRYSQE